MLVLAARAVDMARLTGRSVVVIVVIVIVAMVMVMAKTLPVAIGRMMMPALSRLMGPALRLEGQMLFADDQVHAAQHVGQHAVRFQF